MTEMIKSIDEQLSLDAKIIEEMKWELNTLGKDIEKDAFYAVDKDGKQTADINKVNAFLNNIKDQEWNELKDQKQDRLRMTAVQIKLVSLGYDIGSKKIDGWFGRATKAAIQKFQKDQEFAEADQDGLPGKKTIKALLDPKPRTTESLKEEKRDQQEKQLDQRLGESNPENIPELKHIYQNLDAYRKTGFDIWTSSITIGDYSYKKENGEIIKFIPPQTWVELIKREHFLDGKWQTAKEVKKEDETKGKDKENQLNSLKQTIMTIPEIKDIYSNMEKFQKNNFELGLLPLKTEKYSYLIKKGRITRTENWFKVPLLPKEEYFENGERKVVKSAPKTVESSKQKVDIETVIAWVPEVQTIYQNLSFLSKTQFKNWNINLSTDSYSYQVEHNTLIRIQKTKQKNFVELPKKEAWKEGKWEKVS